MISSGLSAACPSWSMTFRSRPSGLAPLLSSAVHAVFLLGAPGFRERPAAALQRPGPVRANWGNLDVEDVLIRRPARDQLWHDEIARQAQQYQLPVVSTSCPW